MKDRRGIYLAVFILAASLVYYGCGGSGVNNNGNTQVNKMENAESRSLTGDETLSKTPVPIDRQAIFDDFKDLSDNDIPAGVLGGTFFPGRLYLPEGYKGQAEDIFYLSIEDGHLLILQKYQVKQQPDGSLKYQLIQNLENQDEPEGSFEAYSLRKGEWQPVQ